jgi:hypothetical protein
MASDALDNWICSRVPGLTSLLAHRFLKSPYGYALGITAWPVYLAIWYGTVFASENLAVIPFNVSVIVALGGLLVTSVVSALVMCISASTFFGLGCARFARPPLGAKIYAKKAEASLRSRERSVITLPSGLTDLRLV